MTKILTNTFDPTDGVATKRCRVDFTPTAGTVSKLSCLALEVDPKMTTQTFAFPASTGDGELREVAEIQIDAVDTITIVDITELDASFTLLGGLNGLVMGTAICYIADPRDAAGKVRATISGAAGAAFACSLRKPDGAIRFGNKDVSKTSLLLRNLSGAKLVWTVAGDAPDTVV